MLLLSIGKPSSSFMNLLFPAFAISALSLPDMQAVNIDLIDADISAIAIDMSEQVVGFWRIKLSEPFAEQPFVLLKKAVIVELKGRF